MKIRIDEIPEDGLDLILKGDENVLAATLDDLDPPRGAQIDPRVKGVVRLVDGGNEVVLSARLQARVHLSCFRCLKEFDKDLELTMDLAVRRSVEDQSGDSLVESMDNEILIDGSELDLGDLIVQEILLEVPMKPLCRDDCPGLCPRCGAEKGSGQCSCPEEDVVDPRWQALAKLKNRVTS